MPVAAEMLLLRGPACSFQPTTYTAYTNPNGNRSRNTYRSPYKSYEQVGRVPRLDSASATWGTGSRETHAPQVDRASQPPTIGALNNYLNYFGGSLL